MLLGSTTANCRVSFPLLCSPSRRSSVVRKQSHRSVCASLGSVSSRRMVGSVWRASAPVARFHSPNLHPTRRRLQAAAACTRRLLRSPRESFPEEAIEFTKRRLAIGQKTPDLRSLGRGMRHSSRLELSLDSLDQFRGPRSVKRWQRLLSARVQTAGESCALVCRDSRPPPLL